MKHISSVFLRICITVREVGLVTLTKPGVARTGKEPSPEFVKRVVTRVTDTSAVRM